MKTPIAIVTIIAAVGRALAVAIGLGLYVASGAEKTEKGTSEAPPSAQALEASYFRGKGLPYNLHLTLEAGGKYKAKWHSCLYKPGEASGTWNLSDARITFTPPVEGEMLQRRLESLDVLKFRGEWILVPTDERDRQFYDKEGVTRFSCFQRIDTPSNLVGTWHYENGVMGEFHTLDLRKEGDFSWVLRDEPLRAEDTCEGEWQVRNGEVHLLFRKGRTKSGAPITPQKRRIVLFIVPDDLESLVLRGESEFRLVRTTAKPETHL